MLYSVYVQQITPGELLISTQRRNLLGVLMGLYENEGKILLHRRGVYFRYSAARAVLFGHHEHARGDEKRAKNANSYNNFRRDFLWNFGRFERELRIKYV